MVLEEPKMVILGSQNHHLGQNGSEEARNTEGTKPHGEPGVDWGTVLKPPLTPDDDSKGWGLGEASDVLANAAVGAGSGGLGGEAEDGAGGGGLMAVVAQP